MKMIFVIAVLSAALSVTAFARLGENLQLCAKEYGDPVGNDEIRNTVAFSKDAFLINCHFSGTLCDSITFAHVQQDMTGASVTLTNEEINKFLTENGSGHRWQIIGAVAQPEDFKTDDEEVFAHYDRLHNILVIATKEFKDRQDAEQKAAESKGSPPK